MYIVIISHKIKTASYELWPDEQMIQWYPYFYKLVGLKFLGKRPDMIIVDMPETNKEKDYVVKCVMKAVKNPFRQVTYSTRSPR